ncbi:pentapeptide repeat-containing protein [Microvirga massiliensis]|uniref:pentapeptide repeat-containing protein n=1 Tax=Microvirga massiliensis TaxID=1033741 RepID=UPI00066008D3|nr:pentapeptide repeat-containing protein [Microvirga massiliensis]
MDGSPLSSEFWSWVWETHRANPQVFAPLATLIAALIAFVAASAAAWAALRQAKIARQRHEAQTDADRQRRITESFTKAVEQLGSDKLEVRLGGIYTLERISRESEPDYWPIIETLTAFVRERARWKDEDTTPSQTVARLYEQEASQQPNPSPPTDIAAILTVIKRREDRSRERERSENWRMDLRSTDLRRADLRGAHLQGANLIEAHLEGANLAGAHLQGAELSDTYLQGAELHEAHLEMASLVKAHLEGARLTRAHLEGASLWDAHLEGARLYLAHLKRVQLTEAHLEGANLVKVHLEEADLREAHLEGADLEGTTGLTQDQLDAAHGNAETKLPKGLTRPARWSQ